MYFHLPPVEIRRLMKAWQPTIKKMEHLGFFAEQQVMDRFQTQGASGGKPWAPKKMKSWGYDDGRSILTGSTANLKNSFYHYAPDANTAIVGNDRPYSHIQQVGTIKAGGILPTIVPKKAKALWIPITDRAKQSTTVSGTQAALMVSMGEVRRMEAGHRAGVRFPKKGMGMILFGLIPGRLKYGRLQKKDAAGNYVDGIPDFIFLSRVNISPRPMLPDGENERSEQAKELASLFGH